MPRHGKSGRLPAMMSWCTPGLPAASAAGPQQVAAAACSRASLDFCLHQFVLLQWVGQPGNFGLMVKQGYGLLEALQRARRDGQHWLLHLDPDELFHPGGRAAGARAAANSTRLWGGSLDAADAAIGMGGLECPQQGHQRARQLLLMVTGWQRNCS